MVRLSYLKITLTGEPKSTQNCYKHACRGAFPTVYMKPECKALKEDYQWQIRSQYNGPVLTSPLAVEMTIYFGTKRKADVDNFNKLVFDALTDLVYEDDSQIEKLTIVKDYDKDAPRVELMIDELKPD